MPSGQDTVPVPALGCGIRLGTTAVMVSDGMILGGMVLGTDIAVCIVLGIIAGTIPGTTDGTIHTGVHGDGTTTDIPATTARGIIHIATTMDMLTTTMVAEVAAVTTTDILVTLELSTRMVVQVIARHIATLLLTTVRVWVA